MLFFNEMEDYGKVLLHCFHVNGHFWSFYFFFALFGMSQLLVTGYLPQMWKNVTSNNYFETPCGFKGFILPEVIYSKTLYSSQGY